MKKGIELERICTYAKKRTNIYGEIIYFKCDLTKHDCYKYKEYKKCYDYQKFPDSGR